jgi:polysaccharide export outer membrane protein
MDYLTVSLPSGARRTRTGWRAPLSAWRLLVVLALVVTPLAWAPSGAVAAGPDYRIGTDDILTITVWDQKELDQVVFVRPDGKISLPLVGEVEAGGLTVAELAARLTKQYSQTVRGAQVTVIVKEIRSRPVFFLGGIVRPGPIQLTQDLTVLQALSAVGGPLTTADLEGAFVLRGDTRIPVNLLRIMQKGDVTQNVRLQPGDTVVVPSADAVYVQGEIKTPGQVKYSSDLTIVTAIAAAGGFTPLAAPGRVSVVRGDGGKKQTFRVDVGKLISDPANTQDVPLKPNDIVIVPQRLF